MSNSQRPDVRGWLDRYWPDQDIDRVGRTLLEGRLERTLRQFTRPSSRGRARAGGGSAELSSAGCRSGRRSLPADAFRADVVIRWSRVMSTTSSALPYRVSAQDPEVLLVTARTVTCDCRWYLELDWSSQGRSGTVRIDDARTPVPDQRHQGAAPLLVLDARVPPAHVLSSPFHNVPLRPVTSPRRRRRYGRPRIP